MSSSESIFLDAIREAPAEKQTETCLTFADWLEEHGDPRSVLLRQEVVAAEILGRENVHGILDAQAFYGQIEPEIVEQLAKAPFPAKNVLQESRDHLLVLCPGYSLVELRQRADCIDQLRRTQQQQHHPLFLEGNRWYLAQTEVFAQERHSPRWTLFRRIMDNNLCYMYLPQQNRAVTERYPQYRMLEASELAAIHVLHSHLTGKRLTHYGELRTTDCNARNLVVSVIQNFNGLEMRSYNPRDIYGAGVALARRF